MILCFDDYSEQAEKLADSLNMQCQAIVRHQFPDGECKLKLPTPLPSQVIFYRSLDNPNEKLIDLLLAGRAARELGATELTLIAPYLCYMRQDIAFNPGETVSQRIIGQLIADLFDNVLTVDPHLHRVHHFEDAVPARRAIALHATPVMIDFLREHTTDPVLLGPDIESEQWVRAIAESNGWTYAVCSKQRHDDRKVSIELPNIEFREQSIVLLDDIISSGETMAKATAACLEKGAKSVDVLVTHALFADGAERCLQEVGVRHIWSTDSVRHTSNAISLCGLLRDAVLNLDVAN